MIVNHMMKHKRVQSSAKVIPSFVIPTGIVKELADMMQVWTLNESACLAVVRQLPDLHLHDVDFYIWMRKISSKEDMKLFKQ